MANTNESEAIVQSMNVRIKPEDSMNIVSIVKFYDNVAETLGLDKDTLRYDCTKIDVARNIQENIFSGWEKLGAGNLEIGMTWCNSGPKTEDKLPQDTISIGHGFFRNENNEPLFFNDLFQQKQRHYIEGSGFPARDELKELGCQWDAERKQWYALSAEIAAKAQSIIDKTLSAEITAQVHDIIDSDGKHYIPNVPLNMFKAMKELGCQWDADAKCWYHDDPKIAKEAERLTNEARERDGQSIDPSTSKKTDHEM